MKPSEAIIEAVPTVSMDPDAHFAQPRFWEKTILGRPLTNAVIARYQRQDRYRKRRAQWQQSGNRLVYSA